MKNPKEEAIELFNSMKGLRVKHSHSKKCAKVCVNKILEAVDHDFGIMKIYDNPIRIHYLQVLAELDKL